MKQTRFQGSLPLETDQSIVHNFLLFCGDFSSGEGKIRTKGQADRLGKIRSLARGRSKRYDLHEGGGR